MMHETADDIVPMFSPMHFGEPDPKSGLHQVPDTPGSGVELNPKIETFRPYTH